MKVFRASYSWSGRYGAFEDSEYIVVANTENEALGMALEVKPCSGGQNWDIIEIDTTKECIHFITERGD